MTSAHPRDVGHSDLEGVKTKIKLTGAGVKCIICNFSPILAIFGRERQHRKSTPNFGLQSFRSPKNAKMAVSP